MQACSFLRHAAQLLFAALALLSATAAHAQWTWRSGGIYYTPACDPIVGGCQSNGTGYLVSHQWVPSGSDPLQAPLQPRPNLDGFYVSVYMQGIALLPRIMAVHIIPPPGLQILVNPAAPVRCFYTDRRGDRTQHEFTNQPHIDDSVAGGSLVIGGCPQPTASGPAAPFPLVTLSSGAGTAYKLRRNCNYAGAAHDCSDNWPMATGASYEFLIPVVATRSMDGFSDGDRFIAPIAVLQADFSILWTYPRIPIFTAWTAPPPPPPPPASADMQALLARGVGGPGATRVEGRCLNNGASAASNVSCAFVGLPAGASVVCTPDDFVASLGQGQSILCNAQFPNQATEVTVSLQASAFTNDPQPANNAASLSIAAPPPPAGSADLRTSLALGQGTPGQTRVVGRCTNFGPDAATNVSCTYRGLPAGAQVACTPNSPQGSLGLNSFIECTADFPNQAQALALTLEADSSTTDPAPGNDQLVLDIAPVPGGVAPLLRDGFETR